MIPNPNFKPMMIKKFPYPSKKKYKVPMRTDMDKGEQFETSKLDTVPNTIDYILVSILILIDSSLVPSSRMGYSILPSHCSKTSKPRYIPQYLSLFTEHSVICDERLSHSRSLR